jgi:hypothetical protein
MGCRSVGRVRGGVMLNKTKKIKPIKDEDLNRSNIDSLSPSEALERFYRLKEEEKKQRLLEEVREIGILLN